MTDVQTVPVVPGYSSMRAVERDDYAAVFEAESARQRVRIVCLDASVRGQGQLTQAFLTQARAVESVNHPAFLGVRDAAAAGTHVYVIAEQPSGSLLDDLATDTAAAAPTPVAIAQIGFELAYALAALHEAGLTHGDLTPRGIFLMPQGLLRISPVSLGCIARSVRPRQLCRRLLYQAPEALREQALRVEPSADVYALGVVLCEVAYGRLLARAETLEAFVGAVRRGLPAIPSSDRSLPGDLQDIIQRALDRDPSRRPSAGELTARLAGIAGSAGRSAVAALAARERSPASLPHQSRLLARSETSVPSSRTSRLSLTSLPRKSAPATDSRRPANWLRRLPRVTPRRLPPPPPSNDRLWSLSDLLEYARTSGLRSASDFIRRFPPAALMAALGDQPQARALLLVLTTGIRREVALKKSVPLAAEDLQIALDEGVTDAEAVIRHFVGLGPALSGKVGPGFRMVQSASGRP